ncbi:MAG: transposase [Candidatus Binatia bacterium]
MENFAGADLHKRLTQLALLREGKAPLQYRFLNDPVTVRGVLRKLPGGTKIALESTGSWWWFVDGARGIGHEVFLSHPKQTKAIASARLKSDKVDAPMLAKVLKADLLPVVWIPGERGRHALYAKRNVEVPGMIWHRVRPLPWRIEELSGYAPRIVQENVELLRVLNEQIRGLDKELSELAAPHGALGPKK